MNHYVPFQVSFFMIIQTLKNTFHIFECLLADLVFFSPGRRLTLIGVTGTDGKTTTTHVIYHILRSSGKSVSMISSISAQIGDKTLATGFHTTTPRPWKLRQLLWEARRAGSQYFVLETTSHALTQNRVWGLSFFVSVLTNITHEHQLHHKNFDDYIGAKVKLLISSKTAIINRDAEIYDVVSKILKKKGKTFLTYSLFRDEADYVWSMALKTKFSQDFNKENVLAAYACCRILSVTEKKISAALSSFDLPQGRLDIVYDNSFKVIIDFAHTPNAILRLLYAIKKSVKAPGRLIHVFGAASQRDDTKRPLMGAASGESADIVILTEEDKRLEDIQQIFNSIAPGLTKQGFSFVEPKVFDRHVKRKSYSTFENRGEAIGAAIRIARRGDVVVLTGKGHEKSLARGKIEESWDEYSAVEQALLQTKKGKLKTKS